MNRIFLRFLQAVLTFCGFFLGFAKEVAAQYGIIECDYMFMGNVVSTECNLPVKNIQVMMDDPYDREHNLKTNTNEDGTFSLRMSCYMMRDSVQIHLKDVNGKKNGLFKDTSYWVSPNENGIVEGGGGWHIHKTNKTPLVLKMHQLHENPCNEPINDEPEEPAERIFDPVTEEEFYVREDADPERNTTSVENDTSEEPELIIYPNPSTDYFYLRFPFEKGKTYEVLIFDEIGKCVHKESLQTEMIISESYISVKNMAIGLYQVCLRTEGAEWIAQVILR